MNFLQRFKGERIHGINRENKKPIITLQKVPYSFIDEAHRPFERNLGSSPWQKD